MSENASLLLDILDNLRVFYSDEVFIEKYEPMILEMREAELSYYFLLWFGYDCSYKKHLDIIIDSGDPKINYLTAIDFPTPAIIDHERVVLESKNPDYNYYFPRDVKDYMYGRIKHYDEIIDSLVNLSEIDPDNAPDSYVDVTPETVFIIRKLCEIDSGMDEIFEESNLIVFSVDKDSHRKVIEESGNEDLLQLYKMNIDGEYPKTKSL